MSRPLACFLFASALFFLTTLPAGATSPPFGYQLGSAEFSPVFNTGSLVFDSNGTAYFSGNDDGLFTVDKVYRKTPNGTPTVYAQGFSFAGALAIHPSTGDMYAGDSGFGVGTVYKLHDGNNDGDALDVGENTAFLPMDSVPNVYGLAFHTDGRLFISNAAALPFSTDLNIVYTASGGGTLTVFRKNVDGGYAGEIRTHPSFPDKIFLVTTNGIVYQMKDGNADNDAEDGGEFGVYADINAALGKKGGSGLAFDAEGDLFTSMTEYSGFSAVSEVLAKLGADSNLDDQADSIELFINFTGSVPNMAGLAFNTLTKPFEAYASNGATLYVGYSYGVQDFYTVTPASSGSAVPAMSPWGGLALCLAFGLILAILERKHLGVRA